MFSIDNAPIRWKMELPGGIARPEESLDRLIDLPVQRRVAAIRSDSAKDLGLVPARRGGAVDQPAK
jgi:hypothetical protein